MTHTIQKITTNIQGDFDNNIFAYNAYYNRINLNLLWLTILRNYDAYNSFQDT